MSRVRRDPWVDDESESSGHRPMKPNPSRWNVYLWGILLVVPSLISSYLLSDKLFLQDLSIYWRSAHQFLLRQNPYDIPPVMTFSEGEFGLVNLGLRLSVWAPPYYLAPLLPFALLPLAGAKALYTALLFLGVSGWLVANAWGVGEGMQRYRRIGIALIAFPWFVWYDALRWGGMGVLGGCGFLLLTLGLKHQKQRGGTLLTVTALHRSRFNPTSPIQRGIDPQKADEMCVRSRLDCSVTNVRGEKR